MSIGYFNRIIQNVVEDSNNTSNSNLAAGASFVGLATSTLGVAGIQVQLKTDQNCTVALQQSTGLSAGVGTITITGTNTITGTSTKFLRDLTVGDVIVVDPSGTPQNVTITAITSDVLAACVGATNVSGKAFNQYYWDISDVDNYYASINNFGDTTAAISAYERVIITNVGSATTTYFRLSTVLCPIIEPLPRATDTNGNLKVSVNGIEDDYGFTSENTPLGEMRVAELTRLVGTNFEGTTIDPNFWTATTANSATIAQANSQIVLTSGTNSSGSAQLNTARRARYVSGTGMRFRAVMQLGDTGTASNVRVWGTAWGSTMPTITDGAYFRLNGTTFSVTTLKGGSPTEVTSGSFNGTLGATYAPTTAATTYEIYWTNLKVYFVVGGLILHTVSADTTSWSATMSPHAYMHNINAGSTTSVTLSCRVASIARLGQLLTQPTSYYHPLGTTAGQQLKYGLGNIHSIVVNSLVNNAVITLSDSTSTTTPVLWSHTATATAQPLQSIDLQGMPFFNGLRLTVSGANANVVVVYE